MLTHQLATRMDILCSCLKISPELQDKWAQSENSDELAAAMRFLKNGPQGKEREVPIPYGMPAIDKERMRLRAH